MSGYSQASLGRNPGVEQDELAEGERVRARARGDPSSVDRESDAETWAVWEIELPWAFRAVIEVKGRLAACLTAISVQKR